MGLKTKDIQRFIYKLPSNHVRQRANLSRANPSVSMCGVKCHFSVYRNLFRNLLLDLLYFVSRSISLAAYFPDHYRPFLPP